MSDKIVPLWITFAESELKQLPQRQGEDNVRGEIMKICARKITKGSLFKLLGIGISIPFLPFFLLCGIASMFGADTVHWDGKTLTGIVGLISAVLMYPVFSLIFTCISWLFIASGLWIYSKFAKINLTFVDGDLASETLEKNVPAQPSE